MPQEAAKISFVSLGCPKALVDSERILTRLRAEGYELARHHRGADAVIVNTCGFLETAQAESLETIDPAGLPPTMLQVGSDEILRDDSVRMAEKQRAAGCDVELEVWPRMPHVWHLFTPVLPEARQAIEHVGTFLQNRL